MGKTYTLRILKDTSDDRVNMQLSASRNRWEARIFEGLADLMQKHEILQLHFPMGKTYLEIQHCRLEYLKGMLLDLTKMGFLIECPLAAKKI